MYKHTHAQSHTHTHVQKHTCTHIHKHTHTHTRTITHTHTHTHPPSLDYLHCVMLLWSLHPIYLKKPSAHMYPSPPRCHTLILPHTLCQHFPNFSIYYRK